MMPRLDAVAAGKSRPASPAEAVEFFNLCRQPFLKRYAAAARLYADACGRSCRYGIDWDSAFQARPRYAFVTIAVSVRERMDWLYNYDATAIAI